MEIETGTVFRGSALYFTFNIIIKLDLEKIIRMFYVKVTSNNCRWMKMEEYTQNKRENYIEFNTVFKNKLKNFYDL